MIPVHSFPQARRNLPSLSYLILPYPLRTYNTTHAPLPFQRQKKDKWKGYKNEKKKDKNDPPPPIWFFFYATSFRKRNGLEKGKRDHYRSNTPLHITPGNGDMDLNGIEY